MNNYVDVTLVVYNGQVCEMYKLADGSYCYVSERTGEIVKRERCSQRAKMRLAGIEGQVSANA